MNLEHKKIKSFKEISVRDFPSVSSSKGKRT